MHSTLKTVTIAGVTFLLGLSSAFVLCYNENFDPHFSENHQTKTQVPTNIAATAEGRRAIIRDTPPDPTRKKGEHRYEDDYKSYLGQKGDDAHPDWLVGYFTVNASTTDDGCGTTSGTNLTPDGYWTNGAGYGKGGTWSYQNGVITYVLLEEESIAVNKPTSSTTRVDKEKDGYSERFWDNETGKWYDSRYYRCGPATILLTDLRRLKWLRSKTQKAPVSPTRR